MDSMEDDLYSGITEFSHEEMEQVMALCKSLIAENTSLQIQLKEVHTQIASLEKSKMVLKRNFNCLLATAKAEIQRKDVRISELQKDLDDRDLRRSGLSSQQLSDIVDRRVQERSGQKRRRSLRKSIDNSRAHQILASVDKENVSFRFSNSSFTVVCGGQVSQQLREQRTVTLPQHCPSLSDSSTATMADADSRSCQPMKNVSTKTELLPKRSWTEFNSSEARSSDRADSRCVLSDTGSEAFVEPVVSAQRTLSKGTAEKAAAVGSSPPAESRNCHSVENDMEVLFRSDEEDSSAIKTPEKKLSGSSNDTSFIKKRNIDLVNSDNPTEATSTIEIPHSTPPVIPIAETSPTKLTVTNAKKKKQSKMNSERKKSFSESAADLECSSFKDTSLSGCLQSALLPSADLTDHSACVSAKTGAVYNDKISPVIDGASSHKTRCSNVSDCPQLELGSSSRSVEISVENPAVVSDDNHSDIALSSTQTASQFCDPKSPSVGEENPSAPVAVSYDLPSRDSEAVSLEVPPQNPSTSNDSDSTAVNSCDFFPQSSSASSGGGSNSASKLCASAISSTTIEDACDSFPVVESKCSSPNAARYHKLQFDSGRRIQPSNSVLADGDDESNLENDLNVSDDTVPHIIGFPTINILSSDSVPEEVNARGKTKLNASSDVHHTSESMELNSVSQAEQQFASEQKRGTVLPFGNFRSVSISDTGDSDVELDACLDEVDYKSLDVDAETLRSVGVSPRKLGVCHGITNGSSNSQNIRKRKVTEMAQKSRTSHSTNISSENVSSRSNSTVNVDRNKHSRKIYPTKKSFAKDEARMDSGAVNPSVISEARVKCVLFKMSGHDTRNDVSASTTVRSKRKVDTSPEIEEGEITENSSSQPYCREGKSVRRIAPICLSRTVRSRGRDCHATSSSSPAECHIDRAKRQFKSNISPRRRTSPRKRSRSPCSRRSNPRRQLDRNHTSISPLRNRNSKYRANVSQDELRTENDQSKSQSRYTKSSSSYMRGEADSHSHCATEGKVPRESLKSTANAPLRRSPRKRPFLNGTSSSGGGSLCEDQTIPSKKRRIRPFDDENDDEFDSRRKLSKNSSIISRRDENVHTRKERSQHCSVDDKVSSSVADNAAPISMLPRQILNRSPSISPEKRKKLSASALAAKNRSMMMRRQKVSACDDIMSRTDLFDPEATISSPTTTSSLASPDVGSPGSNADSGSWACDGAKLKRYMDSFLNNTPYHEDTVLNSQPSASSNIYSNSTEPDAVVEEDKVEEDSSSSQDKWPQLVSVDIPQFETVWSQKLLSEGHDKSASDSATMNNTTACKRLVSQEPGEGCVESSAVGDHLVLRGSKICVSSADCTSSVSSSQNDIHSMNNNVQSCIAPRNSLEFDSFSNESEKRLLSTGNDYNDGSRVSETNNCGDSAFDRLSPLSPVRQTVMPPVTSCTSLPSISAAASTVVCSNKSSLIAPASPSASVSLSPNTPNQDRNSIPSRCSRQSDSSVRVRVFRGARRRGKSRQLSCSTVCGASFPSFSTNGGGQT